MTGHFSPAFRTRMAMMLIAIATLLTGTACSWQNLQCPALPGGGHYCLQSSQAMPPFSVQQEVRISLKQQNEVMITSIETNADGINFVGLTPFGQKLLHVSYDNHAATSIVSPDKRLNPALMIALLQISLWPTETVRSGLSPDLTLEDHEQQRTLLSHGQPSIDIHYIDIHYEQRNMDDLSAQDRRMHITIPALTMSLDIENLPEAEQTP